MNTSGAMALSYAGLLALSLAMDRHQMQVLSRELRRRHTTLLRIAGCVLLTISLSLCLQQESASVGVLWWLGMLTPMAIMLGLLLAYRPRWARRSYLVALSIAALCGLAQSLPQIRW